LLRRLMEDTQWLAQQNLLVQEVLIFG